MNKPARIRELYNLNKTDAGVIFLGIENHHHARNTWSRIENTGNMTSATDAYFDLLIYIGESKQFGDLGKAIFNYMSERLK